LSGERTGLQFRLGDHVRVQVLRASLEDRKIDFRLVAPRTREAKEQVERKPRQAERAAKVTASARPADQRAAGARTTTTAPTRGKAGGQGAKRAGSLGGPARPSGRGGVKSRSPSQAAAGKTAAKTSGRRKPGRRSAQADRKP
jgi:ribonuclease R